MTSLRFRLLFGTLFWIAASVLVAGWGLGRLFHQHVSAQFHAELQTHLDQLTAHLEIDDQGRWAYSTVIVTVNALLLKQLRLPAQQAPAAPQGQVREPEPTAPVPSGIR